MKFIDVSSVLALMALAAPSFAAPSISSSSLIPPSLNLFPQPPKSCYTLRENFVGNSFYKNFDFEAIPDPTHGRVNYTDMATAVSQNLTYADDWTETFILRTDYTTVLDPDGPGRNSVRLRSKKLYTNHVAVIDLRHMPQGCGTWPAIWEVQEADWPVGGEIDIMEGANDQGPNAATLHTSPNCTMPTQRIETGTPTQLDCDVAINYNAGCGVRFTSDPLSFGPPFNTAGGGWFVMERTPQFFKVWFWTRDSTNVPFEVKFGSPDIDTSKWGTPAAYFPNTSTCDFATHFNPHNIIINLTLCGDWAGNTYAGTSCPLTCVEQVNTAPGSFKDAYFDFKSMRIYE